MRVHVPSISNDVVFICRCRCCCRCDPPCDIVQTPTAFRIKGPTALLLPTTPALTDWRRHEVLTVAKKRAYALASQAADDAQELTVDIAFAPALTPSQMRSPMRATAPSSTGGGDDDDDVGSVDSSATEAVVPGLRLLDVFSLRDRVTLLRTVTVVRDNVHVGRAECMYELMETEDERAAMRYCLQREEERVATVRA